MKYIESSSKKSQVYSKVENRTIYALKVLTDAINDISKKTGGLKSSITTGAAIDLLISESLRGIQGIIEIDDKILGSQQIMRYALDCKISNTEEFISNFLSTDIENKEIEKIADKKANILNYISYLENKLSDEKEEKFKDIQSMLELWEYEFKCLSKDENKLYNQILEKNIFERFKSILEKNEYIYENSITYDDFRKKIFEELSRCEGIYKFLIESTYKDISFIIYTLNDDIYINSNKIGKIKFSDDEISNKKSQADQLSVIGELYNEIATESELEDRFKEMIFYLLYDSIADNFNIIIDDKNRDASDIAIAEILGYKIGKIKELNENLKYLLGVAVEKFTELINWSFSTCGIGLWR